MSHSTEKGRQVALWVLWILSTMVMLIGSAAARLVAHRHYHLFEDAGMAELPIVTVPAMGIATVLWIPVLILALHTGFLLFKKPESGGIALALQWIVFVGLCAFIVYGLYLPLDYLCAHLDVWYVR